MSGPEITDPPPDLAAELALGVLDGPERAAAERRRLAEPAFAAEVEAWELRLARIAQDEAAAREPPARLWDRIAQGLGGGIGEGEASSSVVRLRRSVAAWRFATAAATGMAAVLALALAWPQAARVPVAPAAAAPIQAASLSGAPGGAVAFVAVLDPERRELVLTPATISAPGGRSPQLWVIPAGGKPVSVGVAAFGRPVRLSVDALLGGAARRTLAVSLEPQGGSPTGQPTGPVVATGQLRSL